MADPDVRAVVHAALSTVQGGLHHLGLVTLEVLTDLVTEAVTPLVLTDEKRNAIVTEALVKAGVQYVDCQECGAARPVAGTCGNCAFKAWVAAEQAARGLSAPEAGDGS